MKELEEPVVLAAKQNPSRIQTFIVDHPWTSIVACLLLVAICSSGLSELKINNDPRALFSQDNPGLKYLYEVEDTFTADDSLVFILHPANEDIFTQETLTAIKELTQQAWTIPMSLRVDSLTNFQHTVVDGDDLYVYDLVDEPGSLGREELKKIRDIALGEPYLVKNLVSGKGHVAGINVSMVSSYSANVAPEVMKEAYRLRNEFREKYPNIEFKVSGLVAYQDAMHTATRNELVTTSIYGFIAILVCLYAMLRSWASVVLTIVVIQLSIACAIGITLLIGVQLTPTIGLAPAMILTLAVADSIHILMTYQHQVRLGEEKREDT